MMYTIKQYSIAREGVSGYVVIRRDWFVVVRVTSRLRIRNGSRLRHHRCCHIGWLLLITIVWMMRTVRAGDARVEILSWKLDSDKIDVTCCCSSIRYTLLFIWYYYYLHLLHRRCCCYCFLLVDLLLSDRIVHLEIRVNIQIMF